MILLVILIVFITQIGQVLLIVTNQDTNPLVFIVPLDLLMLVGIFYIAGRIK
jgi:hypothetical protein